MEGAAGGTGLGGNHGDGGVMRGAILGPPPACCGMGSITILEEGLVESEGRLAGVAPIIVGRVVIWGEEVDVDWSENLQSFTPPLKTSSKGGLCDATSPLLS